MNKRKKNKIIFSVIGIIIFIITCYVLRIKGFSLTESTAKDKIIVPSELGESYSKKEDKAEQKNDKKEDTKQEQKIDDKKVENSKEKTENSTEKTIKENKEEKPKEEAISEKKEEKPTEKEKKQEEKNEVKEEKVDNTSLEQKQVIPEENNNPKFIKNLSYETEEFIVTVNSIENDVIPYGTTLEVKPIDSNNNKYQEIKEKLTSKVEEEDKLLAGFLAYDIKLKDIEGKEIEPNGKVNVVFDYKKAIKPDVDSKDIDIGIHHFEEDNNGKVKQVVDLEDNKQLQDIKVDNESKVERVEFETNSFSTFTITYRYKNSNTNYTTYVTVNVHYVDESGNEINANQNNITMTFDRTTNTVNEIVLQDYANKLTGIDKTKYTYIDTHYASYNGKLITKIEGKTIKDAISVNPKTVKCTIKFLNEAETVGMIEYESASRAVDIYMVYADNSGISISDTIANDGCINALTGGNIIPCSQNIIYKWYRSTNGESYNKVNRIKVTGDLYNILEENGPTINIALDEGANRYYKVEKYLVNSDGTEKLLGEAVYHIPYFNDVQNGNFEQPKVKSGSNDQIPNGSNGVVWKTTGLHNGQDIEIVNANSAGQNSNDANEINKTLNDYNFAYVPEGNQCAELNAEEYGALYQDILTVPGSQLYWSLYHRARGGYSGATTTINNKSYPVGGTKTETNATDVMYVVAMASEEAEKLDITTQDKVLELVERIKAKQPGYEDIEVITIKTTNNGKGIMQFLNGEQISVDGIQYGSIGRDGTVGGGSYTLPNGQKYSFSSSTWHYYSGHFSIPTKQYLTRFFFVSGITAVGGSNTMGNLLDDIKVSDVIPAPNPGQATIRLTKNVAGLTELPADYSAPLSVKYQLYENKNNTSTGITETTKTRNFDSYSLVYDENDVLTGERKQWHDYTLSIPANGKGKLVSSKELSREAVNALNLNSNGERYLYGYEVEGYNLETSYVVKKKAKNQSEETIIGRGIITNYQSDIELNEDINNGDFIEVEFTNKYTKHTAEITINKINVEKELLLGASFNLKNLNNMDVTLADEDLDGKVKFSDINYSTDNKKYIYTLTEMESPKGYYKFNKPIEFYVTCDENNGKNIIHIQNAEEIADYVSLNEEQTEINVINISKGELPKAGGEGSKMYQIIGISIIVINVYIINLRKNRRKIK